MRSAIGILVGNLDPDDIAYLEAAGIDSLWAAGHVTSPNPVSEALASFIRLAALSKRATVGTAIVALPLYPPALVAKQVADVDRWAGGRVVLGVGVGGEYPEEFRACGVPIEERGARTNEAIPLIRELWTGKRVTHRGRFYQIEDVHLDPLPAQPGGPPIVVAGRQEVAMRRAALLGDGWMPYLYSASRYARSVELIKSVAEEAGRNLSSFQWMSSVFVTIAESRAAGRQVAASSLGRVLRAEGNPDFEQIVDRVAVTGTPDDVVRGLREMIDAGVRHLVLCPLGDDRRAGIRGLVEEVVPALADYPIRPE
jgi:alkanesulfonate monooxygenase SsuD/methylene tetrahydromethanopterin reductase-like flavin-dependent oxidoreductase (luciferase family)